MSDNVKVAVRVRPLLPKDIASGERIKWAVENNIIYERDENGFRNHDPYSFDHIFDVDKNTATIYREVVEPLVETAISGINTTVFAYGQTSSGKTHTMMGSAKEPGIIPRAVEDLFKLIRMNPKRKFLIRVSYLEIYNEKINDLLNKEARDVKLREDYSGNVVVNVREQVTTTIDEVLKEMRKGDKNRQIGETNMNEKSSRSHSIFRIIIESTEIGILNDGDVPVQVSQLNLVDLAGSERVGQAKTTGIRMKEGTHINKSLSTLGLVIRQLSEGAEFVNFRDSKLTRMLQHSLGGNAKTLIVATITPFSIENGHSTLAFAQRAKTIKNKPEVNEILTDSAHMKRYAQKVSQLKKELEKTNSINRNLETDHAKKNRIIEELTERIQLLERTMVTSSSVAPISKRRHTIDAMSFTGATPRFLAPITEELKIFDSKLESCTPLDQFEIDLIEAQKEKQHSANRDSTATIALSNVTEEQDVTEFSESISTEYSSPTKYDKIDLDLSDINSTPKSELRERIKDIDDKYHKLLEFNELEKMVHNNDNLDDIEEELKNARLNFSNLQILYMQANKASEVLKNEAEKAKEEAEKAKEEAEKAKEDLENARKEAEKAKEEVERTKKEVEKHRKITEQSQKKTPAKPQTVTKIINDPSLEKEIRDLKQQLADQEYLCEQMTFKFKAREKDLLTAMQELSAKPPEKVLKARESIIIPAINSVSECSKLEDKIATLQLQLTELENKNRELEDELKGSRSDSCTKQVEITELCEQIKHLQEQLLQSDDAMNKMKQMEEQLRKTEQQLTEKTLLNKRIEELELELQTTEKRLEEFKLLEDVNRKLESQITPLEEQVKRLENDLLVTIKQSQEKNSKEQGELPDQLESTNHLEEIRMLKDQLAQDASEISILQEKLAKSDQENRDIKAALTLAKEKVNLVNSNHSKSQFMDSLHVNGTDDSRLPEDELIHIKQDLQKLQTVLTKDFKILTEENDCDSSPRNIIDYLTEELNRRSVDLKKIASEKEHLNKTLDRLQAELKVRNPPHVKNGVESPSKPKENGCQRLISATDTDIMGNSSSEIENLRMQNEALLAQNENWIAQSEFWIAQDGNCKAELEVLKSQINDLNSTNEDLKLLNSNLTTQNENGNLKSVTLEALTDALKKQNDSLNTQYESLKNQQEALLSQNESLISRNLELLTETEREKAQIEDLNNLNKELQIQITAVGEQMEELKAEVIELKNCKAEVEELRALLESKERDLTEARRDNTLEKLEKLLDSTKEELEAKKEKLRAMEKQCEELSTQSENVKAELHIYLKENEEVKALLESKKEEIQTIKKRLDETEMQRDLYKASSETQARELQSLSAQLEAYVLESKVREELVQELRKEIANIENSTTEKSEEIDKLKEDLDKTKQQVDVLTQEIEYVKESDGLKEKQIIEQLNEISDFKETIEQQHEEIERLKSTLQNSNMNSKKMAELKNEEMKALHMKIHKLEQEQIPELEKLVELKTEEITKMVDDLRSKSDQLEMNDKHLKEVRLELAKSLESNEFQTQRLGELQSQLEKKEEESRIITAKVVELESQLSDLKVSRENWESKYIELLESYQMELNSKDANAKDMEALRKEIADTNEEKQRLEENSRKKWDQAASTLKAKCEELEDEKETLQANIQEEKLKLELMAQERDSLKRQMNILEVEVDFHKKTIAENKSKIIYLENKVERNLASIQRLKLINEGLMKKETEHNKEINEYMNQIETLKANCDQQATQLETMKREIVIYLDKIERQNKTIISMNSGDQTEVESMENQLKSAEEKLRSLEAEILELKDKMSKQGNDLLEARTESAQGRTKIKSLQEEVNTYVKMMQNKEHEIAKLKSDLEENVKKVQESFGGQCQTYFVHSLSTDSQKSLKDSTRNFEGGDTNMTCTHTITDRRDSTDFRRLKRHSLIDGRRSLTSIEKDATDCAKCSELQFNLDVLKNQLLEQQKTCQELDEEVEGCVSELRDRDERITEVLITCNTLESKVQELKQAKEQLEQDLLIKTRDLVALQTKCEENCQQLLNLERVLQEKDEKYQINLDALKNQLLERQKTCRELDEEVEGCVSELQDRDKRITDVLITCDTLESKVQELKQSKEQLEQDLLIKTKDLVALQTKCDKNCQELLIMERVLQEKNEKYQYYKNKYKEAEIELKKFSKEKRHSLHDARRPLCFDCQKMQEIISKLENEKREKIMENSELHERILKLTKASAPKHTETLEMYKSYCQNLERKLQSKTLKKEMVDKQTQLTLLDIKTDEIQNQKRIQKKLEDMEANVTAMRTICKKLQKENQELKERLKTANV